MRGILCYPIPIEVQLLKPGGVGEVAVYVRKFLRRTVPVSLLADCSKALSHKDATAVPPVRLQLPATAVHAVVNHATLEDRRTMRNCSRYSH